MSRAIEFEGTITGGHFPPPVRHKLADAMKRMEGKRLKVSLAEPKRYSTDPQRRYYFAVIVEHCREIFYDAGTIMTKEDMHHWLMENVGKWFREVMGPDGVIIKIRRSYMDLNTQETEVHHTLCRQWAAEHGKDVPEPNEEEPNAAHQ